MRRSSSSSVSSSTTSSPLAERRSSGRPRGAGGTAPGAASATATLDALGSQHDTAPAGPWAADAPHEATGPWAPGHAPTEEAAPQEAAGPWAAGHLPDDTAPADAAPWAPGHAPHTPGVPEAVATAPQAPADHATDLDRALALQRALVYAPHTVPQVLQAAPDVGVLQADYAHHFGRALLPDLEALTDPDVRLPALRALQGVVTPSQALRAALDRDDVAAFGRLLPHLPPADKAELAHHPRLDEVLDALDAVERFQLRLELQPGRTLEHAAALMEDAQHWWDDDTDAALQMLQALSASERYILYTRQTAAFEAHDDHALLRRLCLGPSADADADADADAFAPAGTGPITSDADAQAADAQVLRARLIEATAGWGTDEEAIDDVIGHAIAQGLVGALFEAMPAGGEVDLRALLFAELSATHAEALLARLDPVRHARASILEAEDAWLPWGEADRVEQAVADLHAPVGPGTDPQAAWEQTAALRRDLLADPEVSTRVAALDADTQAVLHDLSSDDPLQAAAHTLTQLTRGALDLPGVVALLTGLPDDTRVALRGTDAWAALEGHGGLTASQFELVQTLSRTGDAPLPELEAALDDEEMFGGLAPADLVEGLSHTLDDEEQAALRRGYVHARTGATNLDDDALDDLAAFHDLATALADDDTLLGRWGLSGASARDVQAAYDALLGAPDASILLDPDQTRLALDFFALRQLDRLDAMDDSLLAAATSDDEHAEDLALATLDAVDRARDRGALDVDTLSHLLALDEAGLRNADTFDAHADRIRTLASTVAGAVAGAVAAGLTLGAGAPALAAIAAQATVGAAATEATGHLIDRGGHRTDPEDVALSVSLTTGQGALAHMLPTMLGPVVRQLVGQPRAALPAALRSLAKRLSELPEVAEALEAAAAEAASTMVVEGARLAVTDAEAWEEGLATVLATSALAGATAVPGQLARHPTRALVGATTDRPSTLQRVVPSPRRDPDTP